MSKITMEVVLLLMFLVSAASSSEENSNYCGGCCNKRRENNICKTVAMNMNINCCNGNGNGEDGGKITDKIELNEPQNSAQTDSVQKKPTISDAMRQGCDKVGNVVGDEVGNVVGDEVGNVVGGRVGELLGKAVGFVAGSNQAYTHVTDAPFGNQYDEEVYAESQRFEYANHDKQHLSINDITENVYNQAVERIMRQFEILKLQNFGKESVNDRNESPGRSELQQSISDNDVGQKQNVDKKYTSLEQFPSLGLNNNKVNREIEDEIGNYQQINDQKDANEKSEKLFPNQVQEKDTAADKRYYDLLAEAQMMFEKTLAENGARATLRSEGLQREKLAILQWKELAQIAAEENMSALINIDPNAKTDDGHTILHFCAGQSWAGGVDYLLARKSDRTVRTIKNPSGDRAFHWIGTWNEEPNKCLEVLKTFLKHDQDVNAIGSGGQSILIRLVAYKQTDAVQYLLNHTRINLKIKMTADYFFSNVLAKKGDTALDVARREKYGKIVAMIERKTDVRCASVEEVKSQLLLDDKSLYYLRFLDDDSKKDDAFSKLHPEFGQYIGYEDTTNASAYLKFGKRSEFFIKFDKPDEEIFRVYSAQKERILSWTQFPSLGRGYYMYKSNESWDSTADKYTRFTYNGEYSFSAAPYKETYYPLGVYDYTGYTAIYRYADGGKKNIKFCFQNVAEVKK